MERDLELWGEGRPTAASPRIADSGSACDATERACHVVVGTPRAIARVVWG